MLLLLVKRRRCGGWMPRCLSHLHHPPRQNHPHQASLQQQAFRNYHNNSPIRYSNTNSSNSNNNRGRFDEYNHGYNHHNNSNKNHTPTVSYGNALVIGSSGVLGRCIVQFLQEELHMNVLGADIVDSVTTPPIHNNNDNNDNARQRRSYSSDDPTEFCQLPTDTSDLTTMTHTLLKSVHHFVATTANNNHNTNSNRHYKSRHPYLDVIIVAAGGFEMNPPKITSKKQKSHSNEIDPMILQNSQAYLQSMERMYDQNFNPVVAASMVAQHYMNPHLHPPHPTEDDDDNTIMRMKGTLLVAVGATAALQPTPTMMGYGSAKNAVHYYIQSLGACTGGGISAAAAGDIYTNLKDKQQQYHSADDPMSSAATNHNNSGSGSSPLLDSKLVRQAGRSVRKDIPSYDYLTVVGLLPTMLDTPRNRQSILQERDVGTLKPKKTNPADDEQESYDFSTTLISAHDIVYEIGTWITTPALRPHSGALIKVVPPKGLNATTASTTTTTTSVPGARFELVR
jgi:NAD(P)-dependent dehydrogenase (short-subunit alcohol dehydrogenase family)